MKKIAFFGFIFLLIPYLAACGPIASEGATTTAAEHTENASNSDMVHLYRDGEAQFVIVCGDDMEESIRENFTDSLKHESMYWNQIPLVSAGENDPIAEGMNEILINASSRPECKAVMDTLQLGESVIRVSVTQEKICVIVAYRGEEARKNAKSELISRCIKANQGTFAASMDYYHVSTRDIVLDSNLPDDLRDPCVLRVDQTYYMYGTGWICWKNTTGSLDQGWEGPYSVVQRPADAVDCLWAPEVYFYQDAYYMFTTYLSGSRGRRGCTVLRADHPLGPFVEISDGIMTPEYDCIDGTLYIDPAGQPWMIFVREWTMAPNHVGKMSAAKLSDDFTHLISEPVDLFAANSAPWSKYDHVTDGPFLYTTKKGTLLMLWSTGDPYCVGIARSESGDILGPWEQDSQLYTSGRKDKLDGGHGMIFRDASGQMFLSIHAPNIGSSKPRFIPVVEDERRDTLIWGYEKRGGI